jgi:hypothetical protein
MCLQYQIYLLEPIIPEKLRLLYNDALSLMKVSILHTSIFISFFSFELRNNQNSACSWLVCMHNEFFLYTNNGPLNFVSINRNHLPYQNINFHYE